MGKKLYYKIGEACKALDIQPYVLRYWETEFPVLSPSKSKSGQRVYTEREFHVIRRIKELLYEEGYTIAGAKKKLETEMAPGEETGGPLFQAGAAAAGAAAKRAAPAPPAARLDSVEEERIEQLRRGVQQVLEEARGILALLEGRATPKR